MIDGDYDLLITSGGHEWNGTATLATAGDNLTVDVRVGGFPHQRGTGKVNGDSFTAQGCVKILLVGKIDYEINGTVMDDLLEAKCVTSKGTLGISGLRRS